jgi:hypothetical protein
MQVVVMSQSVPQDFNISFTNSCAFERSNLTELRRYNTYQNLADCINILTRQQQCKAGTAYRKSGTTFSTYAYCPGLSGGRRRKAFIIIHQFPAHGPGAGTMTLMRRSKKCLKRLPDDSMSEAVTHMVLLSESTAGQH